MIFHVNKHEKFQNFHSKPPLSPQSSVPFEKILDPRLRHTYILVSYQKKKPTKVSPKDIMKSDDNYVFN